MYTLHHKEICHPTSREWVVFLHGMGGSSAIWFKQMKEYRKHFNLLLIDLPGHGGSKEGLIDQDNPSLLKIAHSVVALLIKKGIEKAHFIGISLGTIIVQVIQDISPEKVKTMVLGGAVEWIYRPILMLAKIIGTIRSIIPYMWLYRLCAWILMPKKHHQESRRVFVQEAFKLGKKEFFCWYQLLIRETNAFFRRDKIYKQTPTLYLMGSEDYMFLPVIQENYKTWDHSSLVVLAECGHVCNVEKEREFNKHSIEFIYAECEDDRDVRKRA